MIRSLLKLAEIQTKLASQLPLLLGTLYAIYAFDDFKIHNFIFMFLSLLSFDMATTVTNNYYDFKRAVKKSGYGYEVHNAIVRDNLSQRTVLIFLISLLIIATTFGILLYLNTSIIVLLLGIFSFGIGIIYSFGPVPISRTPLGELFSGGVMGLIIPFLSVYIHIYDRNYINLQYANGLLGFDVNAWFIISIFLLGIPPMLTIANIMLANNICDMEEDIVNKRYTLPIHIGKDKALALYKILYYCIYLSIILASILKIFLYTSLLTLLTFLKVN
ncbi:MAG: 1,4-dihydroxy-2-naphthoate polyprenyltransferase, partial [Tissierellia bacterium]|nr:1,4-dihydroxy-2-naphthoate polyprenyltransferase [Tissierellia bacterium]